MISKISEKLTEMLFAQQKVTEEERELYIYGFFMLMSYLMLFVLASTLGLLFKVCLESIVFFVAFQFIRRFAGGYHASTETRCEILSTLSIGASIVLIKLSKLYDFREVLLSVSLVAIVIIYCICPLDTPEKPLSEKEYKYFQNASRIVLGILSVMIVVSYLFNFKIIF